MTKETYCGIGKVPAGKVLGTAEQCLHDNQVRYYGKEQIDPMLLEQSHQTRSSLLKEQLKMKDIEDSAKVLIRKVQKVKQILADPKSTNKKKTAAQKQLDSYAQQKEKLVARLRKQKQVLKDIEARQKLEDKAEKKNRSRSKSKSSSSGSKSKSRGSGSKMSASQRRKTRGNLYW